jgi:hypothetical protein
LIFKAYIKNRRMCRKWTSWNVAKVKWNCSNVLNHSWWNGLMLNWKESYFFYSIFNFKAPFFFLVWNWNM